MTNDKEPGSVDNVVVSFIESARAQLASMSTGLQLAVTELRFIMSQAGLIFCLLIVAAGMALVGWGLLLMLGALLLINHGMSVVLAVLCVFLVNTLALVSVAWAIRNTLDHLSFKHTRQAMNSDSIDPGQV